MFNRVLLITFFAFSWWVVVSFFFGLSPQTAFISSVLAAFGAGVTSFIDFGNDS